MERSQELAKVLSTRELLTGLQELQCLFLSNNFWRFFSRNYTFINYFFGFLIIFFSIYFLSIVISSSGQNFFCFWNIFTRNIPLILIVFCFLRSSISAFNISSSTPDTAPLDLEGKRMKGMVRMARSMSPCQPSTYINLTMGTLPAFHSCWNVLIHLQLLLVLLLGQHPLQLILHKHLLRTASPKDFVKSENMVNYITEIIV